MRARIGLLGAGLALIVSEFTPMSILALFLSGRMKTKIQWKSLFAKFDIETWKAVKIGGIQFLSCIFYNIPSFFSRKYLSSAAEFNHEYDVALAAWNISLRL
jgi:Na+-driven multidrug efflux pump